MASLSRNISNPLAAASSSRCQASLQRASISANRSWKRPSYRANPPIHRQENQAEGKKMKSIRTILLVGASSLGLALSAHSAPMDLVGPVSNYKIFVAKGVDKLVSTTAAFTAAVKAGDLKRAQELYAPTRVNYETIEPIAELFNDLDGSIDSRADDHEKKEADDGFTGFHRIEYGLFEKKSTDGLSPLSDKLNKDVLELQSRIKTLTVPPEKMVGGAA